MRGRPRRGGRHLVLTDGDADVSFIDDGSGAAIARWTVKDSTVLRVAARFGAVRISEADQQRIASIPDEFPKVIVRGAAAADGEAHRRAEHPRLPRDDR